MSRSTKSAKRDMSKLIGFLLVWVCLLLPAGNYERYAGMLLSGNRGRYPGVLPAAGVFVCLPLPTWNRGRYPGTLRAAGFFCISLGAHRAAVNTLSEIGKPGSGCTADFTSDGQEPLNREHITCSW